MGRESDAIGNLTLAHNATIITVRSKRKNSPMSRMARKIQSSEEASRESVDTATADVVLRRRGVLL